ncbi:MAG: uridine monophosphate kinase [candidate division WOR-3 bacterium]|nr:uridine monophosphate kinase [candidate division WOR-3 bacterium]
MSNRRYNRVLLKISGDCFSDFELLRRVADQLIKARAGGVRLAVVTGGGNILRGRDTRDMDQAAADKAGMLATVINGIKLTELLGARARVRHFSAIGVPGTAAGYDIWQAREALKEGRILVLSGGTGNPFFSTDSAAALRAAELGMDVLFKGTRVSGVYSADPEKNPHAKLYPRLSYEQALVERLAVMDLTAFALCMERKIPIVVFDIARSGVILDIIKGKRIGSLVC